jgi:hypothetical protein
MSVEARVLRIRQQLETMTGEGDASVASVAAAAARSRARLGLLKALSKMKVDLDILTKTRIGLTVNTIRYVNILSGSNRVPWT